MIKQSPTVEQHLYNFIDPKHRSYLSQIRFGILPLTVETGRYRGTPLEERLCICCSLDSVETEYNFMFECTLYENLRNIWFQKMDFNWTDFNTLSPNEKITRAFNNYRLTAKFICLAMDKRRDKIFS